MAEPRSIFQAAFSLTGSLDELIRDVDSFRRRVIEARAEMTDLSQQLRSIKWISETLGEHAQNPDTQLPPTLDVILNNCNEEVQNLTIKVQQYDSKRRKLAGKYLWNGADQIAAYRNTLTAHEGALKLAVDVMTLSLMETEIHEEAEMSQMDSPTLKTNIEQTVSEIARLQAQVARLERQVGANYILKRYLRELTSYAGSVMSDKGLEPSPYSSGAPVYDADQVPIDYGVFLRVPSRSTRPNTALGNEHAAERLVHTPVHEEEVEDDPSRLPSGQPTYGPVQEPQIGLAVTTVVNQRGVSPSIQADRRPDNLRVRSDPESREGATLAPRRSSSSNEERRQLEQISTETAWAKQKRESFISELNSVPDSKIAPKFGSSYHVRADYKRSWLGLGTVRRVGRGTHAENIKWFKAFTMSTGDIESEYGYSGNRIDTTSAIVAALSIQDAKWLDKLLKEHAKLDRRDVNPCTEATISVLDAAMDWNVSIAKKLIKAGLEPRCKNLARVARLKPDQFDMPTLEAERMLILAAKFLLDNRAPINTERRPSHVEPPLHAAIQAGNAFMARFLLEHGASTELNILNQGTPLHLAITFDHFDIATMVFKAPQTDKKFALQWKAEIARFDSRSKNWRFWGDVTPIELAKKLGKLQELSRALDLPIDEDEQLHTRLRAMTMRRNT